MIFKKLRYRLHLLGLRLMLSMGMGPRLLASKRGSCILVFHGIDLHGNTQLNSRFVSATNFDRLLEYLKNNYELVPVEEIFKKDSYKFRVAITFDDGLKNNISLALPILQKYQAPATFFVNSLDYQTALWPDFLDLVSHISTKTEIVFDEKKFTRTGKDFLFKGTSLKTYCKSIDYSRIQPLYQLFEKEWELIRQNPDWDVYWKRLDPEDIRQLSEEPHMTIAAHGVTHVNLVAVSEEIVQEELLGCKRFLEKIVGKTVPLFAFPFGAYTTPLVQKSLECGYEQIYLVDKLAGEKLPPEAFSRMIINPFLTVEEQVYFMLKGRYLT